MNTSIPGGKPKSHFNLPNTLTWLRILMIPGVVILYYLPFWWAHPAAGVGFALAGITDTLDGYFARKLGLTSRLGAFLDPVADKLIVASALREWMAEIGARGRIKVSQLAKYKTIMQITGLSMMLFHHQLLGIAIYKLGVVLTAIAAVLTLWSMILYLRLAWPELRDSSRL